MTQSVESSADRTELGQFDGTVDGYPFTMDKKSTHYGGKQAFSFHSDNVICPRTQ